MVQSGSIAQAKWNARIPATSPDAHGKFETVAIRWLIHHLNVGGSVWIDQFASGFPIDGSLSRKHVFPIDRKAVVRIPVRVISKESPASYREISSKSRRGDAPLLRGEAMEEVGGGAGSSRLLSYPTMASRWNGALNGTADLSDDMFIRREVSGIVAILNTRWRIWRVPSERRYSRFLGDIFPNYRI